MSGIFGIVRFNAECASGPLREIQNGMHTWARNGSAIATDHYAGLGHALTQCTPTSFRDRLPLRSRNGEYLLTCTSRLDEREALCRDLGLVSASSVDGEILLAAFDKWGENLPEHILGDWSLAIWQPDKQRLFIARDHHGNSGLYYFYAPLIFAFASSLTALLRLREVPRDLNERTIAGILLGWPEEPGATAYSHVRCLPPGHCATVDNRTMRIRRYWNPIAIEPLRLCSTAEYVEQFLDIYSKAIRSRLCASNTAGVMLSGGLDSGSVGLIAALELGRRGQRLRGFTSVPCYPTARARAGIFCYDERALVETLVGKSRNIDVSFESCSSITPLAGIKERLRLTGEPAHAASNAYWIISILRAAEEQGLNVLLTGQLGNCTISWTGLTQRSLVGGGGPAQIWRAVKRQFFRPIVSCALPGFLAARERRYNWIGYSAINDAFARSLGISAATNAQQHRMPVESGPRAVRARMMQLGSSSVGAHWQQIGAGFGLEIRDPTADKRIIEFCLSVPEEQYISRSQNRLLIRRALEGLCPPEVRCNRRIGIQAGDIIERVRRDEESIRESLHALSLCEAASWYLELPRMEGVVDEVMTRNDEATRTRCVSVLMRGLMAGLFLLASSSTG